MKSTRLWLCLVISTTIATSAFYGSKYYLISHVFHKTTTVEDKSNPIDIASDSTPSELDILRHLAKNNDCLQDLYKINGTGTARKTKCDEGFNRSEPSQGMQASKQFDDRKSDEKRNGNTVVENVTTVVEFFLILGLSIQIFFFAYTVWLPKSDTIDYYIYQASDWAINTPPILGVLVNLLAFGAMLSQGAHKIQSLFTENFYLAIVTTLIGGFFYVINMALKIIIQSRIDEIYRKKM